MQHFSGEDTETSPASDQDAHAPTISAPQMLDRSEQKLSNFIGALFSVCSFLCLIGISFLGLFFIKIVAEGGETGMLPIFIALGLSLAAGMLLLDFTHAKALAGLRAAREHNARRSRAFASIVLCFALGMIHPLMALAIPTSAVVGVFGHYILNRMSKTEPLWDFLDTEAVSLLAGRDKIGLTLSSTRPSEHVMSSSMTQAGVIVSFLTSLAAGSYLIASNIMTVAALIPLIFGSIMASGAILEFVEGYFSNPETAHISAHTVERVETDDIEDKLGLDIQGLTIRNAQGKFLMTDVNLHLDPGQVIGVLGESGAGKSLFLQAINDPFSLSDLDVSGRVFQGRLDLWARTNSEQVTPAVLLPAQPIMLPASGADNLGCFHGGDMLERGKWFLERLVFTVDMVREICDAQNAQNLPSMQKKTLALARAFMLGPPLYLLDHPEDGLPEKQIGALIHRISQETRMGRSVLMVTKNRKMLESCDNLIVLQRGRIVDFGRSEEVCRRMDSGWTQFIGNRELETEEILIHWVNSNFGREGDEANRRKVTSIASDMLALSCQSKDIQNAGQVAFQFKHFQGHCILRMADSDAPISVIALQKAQEEAESDAPDQKLSSLASVLRFSMDVECNSKEMDRQITAKIATYDPRKTAGLGNAE